MCIRALDYLPPVDVTFFEYLRALITADFDLVSDDRHNYRVAFVEAFRRRGIYPLNLDDPTRDTPRTLSVDTLRWQGLDLSKLPRKVRAADRGAVRRRHRGLKRYADACFYLEDREKLFDGDAEAAARAPRAARGRLQGRAGVRRRARARSRADSSRCTSCAARCASAPTAGTSRSSSSR